MSCGALGQFTADAFRSDLAVQGNVFATVCIDRTVVSTIIQKGRVSRPIIGITFLESARANTVGIQKGVLVLDVAPNTSAAGSGLRPTTRTQVKSCSCRRGGVLFAPHILHPLRTVVVSAIDCGAMPFLLPSLADTSRLWNARFICQQRPLQRTV